MIRRTALKRGTKPLRRTPLKARTSLKAKSTGKKERKPKTPEQKMRERLWELCKKIIRNTYGNTCYTCGKTDLAGSSWQTGHFIPSSVCGAYLRFDLRNLRPQCFRCNIDLSGNGALFYRRLVEEEGQAYVDQLFEDKKRIVKANLAFYTALVDNHSRILDELLQL